MNNSELEEIYFKDEMWAGCSFMQLKESLVKVREKTIKLISQEIHLPTKKLGVKHRIILRELCRKLMRNDEKLSSDEHYVADYFASIEPLIEDYLSAADDGFNGFARFNQLMYQNILRVSNTPSDSNERKNFELFVELSKFPNKYDNLLGQYHDRIINSARAQVVIARVLLESKYNVISPNPHMQTQIDNWDVSGGTDLVAIGGNGENIIMIDSKFRKNLDKICVSFPDNDTYINYESSMLDDLKSLTEIKSDAKTFHLRINLPLNHNQVNMFGEVIDRELNERMMFGINNILKHGKEYRKHVNDFKNKDK